VDERTERPKQPKAPKPPRPPKARKPGKRKKHRLSHRLRGRMLFVAYWTVQHTLPRSVRASLRRTLFPRRAEQPAAAEPAGREADERRARGEGDA
jgi:hypothetical protein